MWLRLGGRGLDTANVYNTEAETGAAWRKSGLPREDVFLLSKLPFAHATFHWKGQTRKAVESALKTLDVEYLDLMLIHFPGQKAATHVDIWRELEEMHAEGKLRAIGVSNFEVSQLEALEASGLKVPIAVNQRKMSVASKDEAVLDYCLKHNITYQAYMPLGEGSSQVLADPTVARIRLAIKCNKVRSAKLLSYVYYA